MTSPTPSSEELALTLARVAAIAHDGGLCRFSETTALAAVRLLTGRHWNAAGGDEERRQRVLDAERVACVSASPGDKYEKQNPPTRYFPL